MGGGVVTYRNGVMKRESITKTRTNSEVLEIESEVVRC